MKSLRIYSGMALLTLAGSTALTSCQNDFDTPPIPEPKATMVANTTIAELKAKYWQDDMNYYQTVGKTADGEDVIVKGRVISSDATGNIYKSLVIQDETGALAFSVNQTGLNNNYRLGQEVVVNLTELGIGKYAGLQQVGGYGEYNGTPQVSFMDFTLFRSHTELNGFPIQECTYVTPDQTRPDGTMYCIEAEIGNLPTTPEGQRQYQSQLVIFRNVHWEGGGTLPYAEADATTSRNLVDANGNTIIVRNSNYSSFRAQILPAGTGDVIGVMSYFNGTWQLMIRSTADVMFESKGQQSDPYTIAEAIQMQGTGKSGWVDGFIVGSVKAGVSSIEQNSIIWGADAEMDNTLVIAPAADCKDLSQCLVLSLPQGSPLRNQCNLLDNPGLYGKPIKVTGQFDSYMGANGILPSNGDTSSFVVEGVTPGTDPGTTVAYVDQNFDASTSIPTGWTELKVKGNKAWYIATFSGNNYAAMTGYKGTAPFDSWLITPAINAADMQDKVMSFKNQVNGYGSTTTNFDVYIMDSADPTTAKLTKLNFNKAVAPDSGYSGFVESGTISLADVTGVFYIGFCYSAATDANYATWCVDDVLIGLNESQGGPVTPDPGPTGAGSKDEPYSVSYVKGTSADQTGVWVEGYVVGWIDGKTWSTGATFSATTSAEFTNTNLILGLTADANTTAVTIPGAIPAGSLRDTLGLGANPSIYKKHVKVKCDITKYFGERGIKNISEYEIID